MKDHCSRLPFTFLQVIAFRHGRTLTDKESAVLSFVDLELGAKLFSNAEAAVSRGVIARPPDRCNKQGTALIRFVN